MNIASPGLLSVYSRPIFPPQQRVTPIALRQSQAPANMNVESQEQTKPTDSSARRAKRITSRILVCLGGILVLVVSVRVATLAANSSGGSASPDRASLKVNTMVARVEESVYEIRSYAGIVRAARSSDLGFESGGRVIQVLVEEGDVVTAGQPLARLDLARLELKQQTLQDALERARDQLAELDPDKPAASPDEQRIRIRQLQRQLDQMLADLESRSNPAAVDQPSGLDRLQVVERDVGLINETSRTRQIDELEKLEADLESQLKDTVLQLDAGTLTAPFAGVVARRHVSEGAVTGQGRPVIRLVENRAPRAWVGIPADVAARIEVGQQAWLVVGEQTYTGILKSRLPQLDRTNRTRTVILEFAEPEAFTNVIPGEVVSVNIWVTSPQTGIWLPVSSLNQEADGLWSVLVAEDSDDQRIVSWRYVELLRLETDFALVRGTLDAGDKVIVDGLHRITPGQRVDTRDVTQAVARPGPGGDTGQ